MSRLDEWVRERTDALDAAGNSTAAIGKGSINPGGAVAFGTTVRAAIVTAEGSSHVNDLLLNVTSAPTGLETTGEVITKLLGRNTTISTKKGQTFTMCTVTQPGVLLHVEGE